MVRHLAVNQAYGGSRPSLRAKERNVMEKLSNSQIGENFFAGDRVEILTPQGTTGKFGKVIGTSPCMTSSLLTLYIILLDNPLENGDTGMTFLNTNLRKVKEG